MWHKCLSIRALEYTILLRKKKPLKKLCVSRQDSIRLLNVRSLDQPFSNLKHPKTPSVDGFGIWTHDQWQRQL